MFTASLLGKGDKLRSVGYNAGNFFLPIFRFPSEGSIRRVQGIRPVNNSKNSIGDKGCLHFNLKGNITIAPLGSYTRIRFTSITYSPTNSPATVVMPVYAYQFDTFSGIVTGTHIIDVGSDFNQDFYTDWYTDPWLHLTTRTRRNVSVSWYGLVAEVCLTLEFYTLGKGTEYTVLRQRWEFSANYGTYRQTQSVVLNHTANTVNWKDYPFGSWVSFNVYSSCTLEKDSVSSPYVPSAHVLWDRFLALGGTHLYSQNSFLWGDLAQDAADNTRRLDINTPAYLADFLKVKQLVQSYAGLVSNPDLKDVASAYLATTYGVNLTLKDTNEIAKAMQRTLIMVDELPFQVARSRASETFILPNGTGGYPVTGERRYNFKLYYSPLDNGFITAVRKMMSWDVFPTLSNVWDYIPFSFIVDWFIGVQGQLERMDHHTYISTLNVLGCIKTTRTSVTIPAWLLIGPVQGEIVSGDLTFVLYNRELQQTAPNPISRFDLPRSFNHWLEGAALLIQGW